MNTARGPSAGDIMAGDGEVVRIIKDLKNIIGELNTNYREPNLPVTDGSPELHRLCVKLEHLLQLDQKERKTFFGVRRDYWDFFCSRFSKMKGGHKGIEFVNSLTELKTSTGRGRSFIRYCLAQQQLAESLQLCFMEPDITREWYYARNPFLDDNFGSTIISHLYELNGFTFNLALKRGDLDRAWPTVQGRSQQSSDQTVVNEERAQTLKSERPEKDQEKSQGTQKPQTQKTSMSNFVNSRSEHHHIPEERAISDNKLSYLDMADSSQGLTMEKHHGAEKNFQQIGSLLENLAASEKRVIKFQSLNSDLRSQIEKLEKEHQSRLVAVQEMLAAQTTKEQSDLAVRHRLEAELKMEKKKHAEQMEEQSRQLQEMKDSNMFLNETLEELDVLVSDLRQKISENENAKKLRLESDDEHKAALTEAHDEILAKLDKDYLQKQEQYEKRHKELIDELAHARTALESKELQLNEVISEHHQSTKETVDLVKSLEELTEKSKAQESERRKLLLENETQEFKYQQLLSQCKILQDKLDKSQQKVEEQQELLTTLQVKVKQLQVSKDQFEKKNSNSNGDQEANLWEGQKPLEEVQAQIEKTEKKLEVCLMEKEELKKENNSLSETLLSHKHDLCSAKLDVEDLNKQVMSYQEQITSIKNSLNSKENALKYKDKEIKLLKTNLEETTTKLKEALSEKSRIDLQFSKIMEEKAVLVAEKATLQMQEAENVVKLEEALNELKSRFSALEEQMLTKEEEGVKTDELLKTTLQNITEEKEMLSHQLQSTTALLKEQTTTAMQLRAELEQLQSRTQQQRGDVSENLTKLQSEYDALAQKKQEMEKANLALSEDMVQCRYQMKKLELEKLQITDLLEKSKAELQQARDHLSSKVSEKTGVLTPESSQKRENGQKIGNDDMSELLRLQKANRVMEDKLLRMDALEREKKRLQEKLQALEKEKAETRKPTTLENDLPQEAKNGPKLSEESLKEHLETLTRDLKAKDQSLVAKENEVKQLAEQVLSAKQEQELLAKSLEKEKQEASAREESYKEKLAEQKEMVTSMKGRVLELLQEKDALWKKTEGLKLEQKGKTPSDSSMCKTCRKDFKLLSKKYQCRSCSDTICQGCAVDAGKKERYCSPCYQKR